MWGVSESREPIKGEFAEKIIEEVAKIREQKMKKDYISNEKFDEKFYLLLHQIFHLKCSLFSSSVLECLLLLQ